MEPDENKVKVIINEENIDPGTMEIEESMKVVWVDAEDFDPETMQVVGCSKTYCVATYCQGGFTEIA